MPQCLNSFRQISVFEKCMSFNARMRERAGVMSRPFGFWKGDGSGGLDSGGEEGGFCICCCSGRTLKQDCIDSIAVVVVVVVGLSIC